MATPAACGNSAAEIRRLIYDGSQVSSQPSALPSLLQALDDDGIDIAALAQVVERFPNIAARLVSLANSAWCAPVEPVTNVERACAQLGLRLVRSISLSLAIMAPFDATRCAGFESKTFWSNTFLVAESAENLACCAGNDTGLRPETARAAGLFHNLGLLWLADKQPQMTANAIASATQTATSLNDSLRVCCGMDSREVGGLLGRAWELPDVLIAAMEHVGNPDYDGTGWQAAAVVQTAVSVVRAVTHGDRAQALETGLDRLGIGAADCDDVIASVAVKLDGTLKLADTLNL